MAVRRSFASWGSGSSIRLPTRISGERNIWVGRGVEIGEGCWIESLNGGSIEIGDTCAFACYVQISAALSIGTNPHYGGDERRIEAFLLDFEGDLYGRKLSLQLWERLRDELAFESGNDLVVQIARDVEATRRAQPPD